MRSLVVGTLLIGGLVVSAAPARAQMKIPVRAVTANPAAYGHVAALPSHATVYSRSAAPQRVMGRTASAAQSVAGRAPGFPRYSADGSLGTMALWNAPWGWPYGYFGCGYYLVTFAPDRTAKAQASKTTTKAVPGETSALFRAPSSGSGETPESTFLAYASGVVVELR
jgi:hypothetical protein